MCAGGWDGVLYALLMAVGDSPHIIPRRTTHLVHEHRLSISQGAVCVYTQGAVALGLFGVLSFGSRPPQREQAAGTSRLIPSTLITSIYVRQVIWVLKGTTHTVALEVRVNMYQADDMGTDGLTLVTYALLGICLYKVDVWVSV